MTLAAEQESSLRDLVDALCEGELNGDALARLDSLLLADDDACRYYLSYVKLHGLMMLGDRPAMSSIADDVRSCVAASATSTAVPWIPQSAPPGSPLGAWQGAIGFFSAHEFFTGYLVATVLFVMATLIAANVYVTHHQNVEYAENHSISPASMLVKPDLKPEPKIVSIARITGMVDCVWVDTDYAPFHDRVVQGDKFMLKSGLMEITYHTGAKVILQGPCTYEVDSTAGGVLSLGKLTARVEKRSGRGGEGERGRLANSTSPASSASSSSPSLPPSPSPPLFSVRTPTAVVTDLGTEFGVEVDALGAVETQVLDGRVRVAMLTKDGTPGAAREVRRGEAVRVAAKGSPIQSIAVQSQRYVRQLPQPRAIRDDFHTPRNYLTEGTSGSIWHGILNAKNVSRLDTQPFEQNGERQTGQLLIAVPEGTYVGWSQPERGRTFKNAPYLYIDVPKGDFDARVRVVSQTEGFWSACGLMARLDDDNFISVDQNKFYGVDTHCGTHSQQAGKDTDANSYDTQIHGECCLRLVREGDAFRAYYSVAGKESFWIPIPWGNDSMLMRRPELKGPMQIGLWYGTFSPITGSVAFDDFSVQGEAVQSAGSKEKQ